MTTFVLVHGAWHGGWCWKRLAPFLRSEGHEIYAQSLTGAGERRHLLSPAIGVDTYAADIAGLVESEELTDVVLVGHSAAGAAISKAAERIADSLRSLVYIDAVNIVHGSSLFDSFGEEWRNEMRASAEQRGEGWYIPPERYRVDHFFGTDCSEADRAWIHARSTPQPIKPYEEKVDLSRFFTLEIPRLYVRCTLSPAGVSARRARELGMRYVELEAGHDAMLSQPARLAARILAFT